MSGERGGALTAGIGVGERKQGVQFLKIRDEYVGIPKEPTVKGRESGFA